MAWSLAFCQNFGCVGENVLVTWNPEMWYVALIRDQISHNPSKCVYKVKCGLKANDICLKIWHIYKEILRVW